MSDPGQRLILLDERTTQRVRRDDQNEKEREELSRQGTSDPAGMSKLAALNERPGRPKRKRSPT